MPYSRTMPLEEQKARRQAARQRWNDANRDKIKEYNASARNKVLSRERQRRYEEANPAKVHASKAAYRAHNREELNASSRQRYAERKAENPEFANEYMRLWKYRLSPAEWVAKLAAQRRVCKVCGSAGPLQLDHCHKTGHVRHFLCGGCNAALGNFNDDAERLVRAAAYLYHGVQDWPDQDVDTTACTLPVSEYHLRHRYSLTLNDYTRLLRRQSGVCAICCSACKTGQALAVDHDHSCVSRVRGLLCFHCNTCLGHVKDSWEVLMALADYLKESK